MTESYLTLQMIYALHNVYIWGVCFGLLQLH